MGVDPGMEDCLNGGGLRAFCSRGDLPHFRGGWAAHGDHLWNLLRHFAGAGIDSRHVRAGDPPVDLVLHRVDRLAGFGDSRQHNDYGSYCRLGLETSERYDQFAVRGRPHHFDLATTTAFSSGLSIILCGGLVYYPDRSRSS